MTMKEFREKRGMIDRAEKSPRKENAEDEKSATEDEARAAVDPTSTGDVTAAKKGRRRKKNKIPAEAETSDEAGAGKTE